MVINALVRPSCLQQIIVVLFQLKLHQCKIGADGMQAVAPLQNPTVEVMYAFFEFIQICRKSSDFGKNITKMAYL